MELERELRLREISDERLRHMRGVAEYMYRHAMSYGLNSWYMYTLGFLHDIGYAFGKENHEWYGRIFCELTPYHDIIRYHGNTPMEYMEEKKLKEEKDVPKELILLWEADLKVDLTGEEVGFDKRLLGIKEKYGEDSRPYKICEETIDWLKKREKHKGF